MKFHNRAPLARRAFLRGTGGALIALPFLDAMRARAQDVTVPKRLVVWFSPCGFNKAGYPSSLDLTGSSLEPLTPHVDDLIVTRGLSMVSAAGQDSADHPSGFAHMLTGNYATISGDDITSVASPSLDQFVASRAGSVPVASSLHGIQSIRTMSWGGPDGSVSGIAPDNNPASAFRRLFDGRESGGGDATQVDTSGLRRASILDGVTESYNRLRCKLGGEDRQRVQSHLDLLSDLESKLANASNGNVGCVVPEAPAAIKADLHENAKEVGRIHMQTLVRGLACDLTRVGTIQWYALGALYGEAYGWDSLGSHHEASHADLHKQYDTKYAELFSEFLDLLKNTTAEDGSPLLNHTAILWMSELGLNSSMHDLADHGVVLAGSAGGYLKTGQYIDFLADHRDQGRGEDWMRQHAPEQYFKSYDIPHNRLLVELANAVAPPDASEVTAFGRDDLGAGGLPELRA